MLGLSNKYKKNKVPKFVKVYESNDIELSVKKFCDEVRNKTFPSSFLTYSSPRSSKNNLS